MTVTQKCRGHEAYYNPKTKEWRYTDDNSICEDKRPCSNCGKYPTPEGHDACLGKIEGVIAACCGHGDETQRYEKRE